MFNFWKINWQILQKTAVFFSDSAHYGPSLLNLLIRTAVQKFLKILQNFFKTA